MRYFRFAHFSPATVIPAAILGITFSTQAQACDRWAFPSEMVIEQANNATVVIKSKPVESGFSGTATNIYNDVDNDTINVPGVMDGTIEGSNVEIIIYWSERESRITNSIGNYTGKVGPTGRMSGIAYDQSHPEIKANWYIQELAQCLTGGNSTAPAPHTGLELGRVQVPPGSATPTLCEAARSARARNSPAAPGLERQCAAQSSPPGSAIEQVRRQPVLLGRVKPTLPIGRVQLDGTPDNRTMCEAAADARARNSPAAAGLERQCEQVRANGGEATFGDIRLSRIYTGGGSAGAAGDFVELRNRGQVSLNLDGWSLQYASAEGTSWQVFPLSGPIAPESIFLVGAQERAPDWSAPIQLGMASGKLALVRSVRALQGACPTDAGVVIDFLGYGLANCALENAVAAGTAGTALERANDGCTDTRDNGSDFSAGSAAALDRGRAIAPCPG